MNVFRSYRVIATLSLFAALSSAPAFGMTVSYYLDQSNINAAPYADGQNYLMVTIADNGSNIDFTVQTLAPLSSNAGTNFGIQSFGFNTSQSISAANIVGLPSSWGFQATSNQDGFGNFIAVVDGTGGSRVDPLSFSITGISGDTPMDYVGFSSGTAGEGNVRFAAHVAGLSTSVTSGYFGGSAPVPEADTYAMLLAGLGLIGFAARRKLV